MARYAILLSLSLSFLVLCHSCSAQIQQVTSRSRQQQQRFQTQCDIQNLNALEPQRRIQSEAGFTEFWDQNDEQLQCANVAVIRHTIQQRGLLVPSYTNAPQLIYVLEGRGLHGVAIPGCPETYQYQQQQQSQGRFQSRDQHQKVRPIRQGDVIALPAGIAHWIYNQGQSNLVLISLYDVGNSANQLDQLFRKFFLAGSPPEEFQGTSQSQGGRSQRQQRPWEGQGRQGRGQQDKGRQPREGQEGQQGQRQEQSGGNILSGFNPDLLAQALNIDREIINKMQTNDPQRGIIVRVQNELQVITPQRRGQDQEEEEEEQYYPQQPQQRKQQPGSSNGLEETFCTMKLRYNINNPHLADVYNPRAGRSTSVNGYVLPILRNFHLSVEYVSLYENALYSPHWNINAHSIMYITRGDGRIQIVSESGDAEFDGQVQEGQLLVVPQGYAVLKKAGNNGLEWVAFKTHEFAKINQLVGRESTLSAFPVDVLANAFEISREEGSRVKNGRREITLFTPSSSPRGGHN